MKRLIKLAVLGGIVYGAVRLLQTQKAEWEGLSEAEVRAKIDTKLGGRVPDEAADQIKEGVVQKMQSMGKLREDEAPVDEAPADDDAAADEAGDDEAADEEAAADDEAADDTSAEKTS